MKTYFFSLLAVGLFLVSCNRSNPSDTELPYHVNLERDIDNISSMPLSYLGSKLEYIPIETDSACLIKTISNVSISDSFLFVSDYYRLLLFNKSGKYIRQIGSNGRGPGEYSRVLDFIVDEKSREVYVLSSRQVLVFDFNGQFNRDFKLGFPSNQFVLNESNELVLHPFNLAQA
ncbi:MAG: 6-bladed beta-propeller, partial [Bacteroidales bacterium]|nr:6-bladed beta-propeller [Bacteroidales bacterium]